MYERFGREWHVPTTELAEAAIFLGDACGQPMVLDPRNTYLNIFGEGDDSCYNQIVHSLPSEHILIMPLNHTNMEPLKQRLLDEGYPVYHTSEPDETVLAWFAQIVSLGYEGPES